MPTTTQHPDNVSPQTTMTMLAGMPVEKAQLVSAVTVIWERIARLDADDRELVWHIVKDLITTKDDDDRGMLGDALMEVLDQEPDDIEDVREEAAPAYARFVGENVKKYRKDQKLTQDQLAERADLPQPHISRIEQGKTSPSSKTIEKIAKALGIDPGDLDPC